MIDVQNSGSVPHGATTMAWTTDVFVEAVYCDLSRRR